MLPRKARRRHVQKKKGGWRHGNSHRDLIPELVRIPRRGLHARVGRHAAQDEFADVALAELEVEVGGLEGAVVVASVRVSEDGK